MLRPEENKFVNFLRNNLSGISSGQISESAATSFCHPNPLIRWFVWQRIRKPLAMTEGITCEKILDFGSGTGVILPYCAPRSKITYALDINSTLIERTNKEYELKNVEIINYLNKSIPLPSESIDLIYALEVFEHIEDLDRVVSEIYRVCKKGGHLLFSGPTENFFYRVGRFFAGFKGNYHKTSLNSITEKIENRFICVKQSKLFKFIPMYLFRLYKKV